MSKDSLVNNDHGSKPSNETRIESGSDGSPKRLYRRPAEHYDPQISQSITPTDHVIGTGF